MYSFGPHRQPISQELKVYSPEYVEGLFPEVRRYGFLENSVPASNAHATPKVRYEGVALCSGLVASCSGWKGSVSAD
jgi:hypothetical protein